MTTYFKAFTKKRSDCSVDSNMHKPLYVLKGSLRFGLFLCEIKMIQDQVKERYEVWLATRERELDVE